MKELRTFRPVEKIKIELNFSSNPDKDILIDQIFQKSGITSTENLAFRTFTRYKDGSPLVDDYVNSTLSYANQCIQKYGAEYDIVGESVAFTRGEPLLSYGYPHPNLGDHSQQLGHILVYDTLVSPHLFNGYATPTLSQELAQQLRSSLFKVIEISYK